MKSSILSIFVLLSLFSLAGFGQTTSSEMVNSSSELSVQADVDLTVNEDALSQAALKQLEADFERIIPEEEFPHPEDGGSDPFVQTYDINGAAAAVSWDGGAGTNNWNDALNWSNDVVPTSSDDITLGSGANVLLIDGNNGVALSLTIQNGASLVVGSKTLTVGVNVDIQSGASLSLSGTIYAGGNWTNNGTFTPNNGSFVRLNGTGNQSISASNFFNLYLQGGATKTATGSLDVNGKLYIFTSVTFDPATFDHNIEADFENDGTLTLGTGTIYLDGPSGQSVFSNLSGGAPGVWNFNDLAIIGSSGSVSIYDTLSIDGDFSVTGGQSVYLRHYNITTPSEGILNGNGGTLTLDVNAGLLIRTERANGAGGEDDNFPHNFNTINLANGANSSLVYYQSNADQIVRSLDGDGDQIQYGRLRFQYLNNTFFPTKKLDGNLDVNQYFYIGPQVTVDVTSNNYSINVWGYWYNYNTFTARGGTVTLDGAYQEFTGNVGTTFYNLNIEGNSGKRLRRNVTVNNLVDVKSGVSYLNLDVLTLSGGGSSSFTLGANVILYVRAQNNFPSLNSYALHANSISRYDRAGNQTVKTGISYGDLYLYSGGTKSLDGVSTTITLNGRLQIGAGTTFDMWDGANPLTIDLYGHYYNYGIIDGTQSTVVLRGSNDVIFYAGGIASTQQLNNLTVNKSGGSAILGSNLQINSDLNLTNGSFGMNATNRSIYVNGNWTRLAGTTFLHGTATVFFQGTSQTITGTGTDDFYSLNISGDTKLLGSDIDLNRRITIQSDGGLDVSINDYNLFVGENFFNNNGGSFDGRNGTVTFDGSSNSTLYIGTTDSLWNLGLNKSGGAYLFYDDFNLSVGGNVSVQSGQLFSGNNVSDGQPTDMNVYGNWTNNGTLNATRNDTVFFLGAAQAITASGANDFNYVVFGGTGTKTLSSSIDINRSANILSGVTLDISGSNTLKIGRNFVNDGTVTSNTSTLMFDSYAAYGAVTLKSNGSNLYNLVVKTFNPAYDLDLQDNLVLVNDLTVTNGDFDITTSNFSISVGGSWTIDTDGEFLARNGVVTFTGAGAGSEETITTNSEPFFTMTLNASNTSFAVQDELRVDDDMTISAGTLRLNGNDFFMGNGAGDNLIVSDSIVVDAGARLRFSSGATASINSGAYIGVTGALGVPAMVTNQGSGTYSFDVNNGSEIGASYYTFEFMNSNGIYVHDGATIDAVDNFSNGTFTNGNSGGTLLWIDNNQTINNISSVSFPSDPGGGASNVTKTLNQGALTFVDASGAFQGAAFESDVNNLISWNYSTSEYVWTGSTSTNWNTVSNWNLGSVPGSTNRVRIPSAPANQPLITSTGNSSFHLTVESGATLTVGNGGTPGEINVTGDVILVGTLVFSNIADTIWVAGNWSNTGTFTHSNNGAIVFTGNSDQNIDAGGTGAGKTFSVLSVDKSGGTAILGRALKVDDNLKIIDGTFDVSSGNYAIEVAGAWLKADTANFLYQQGTVTFSGQDSAIVGSGNDDFYNLIINSTGITLGSALDISGALTINGSSSLDVTTSNFGIKINANWTNNGTFTSQSGTVIFDGLNQTITGSSVTSFNNISFDNGGTKSLNSNMVVNGSLWLNAGNLDINANTITGGVLFSLADGTNFYVEGNANFPSTFNGFSLSQTSYVRYNRAGDQTIAGTDGSSNIIEYGYLYLTNSGTKTAASALDANNNLYIANNVTFDLNSFDMNVGLNWDNNQGGTFVAGSGNTVTLDRTNTQNIYTNATTGDTFPTLVLGGTGAKVLVGDAAVTGDLTLNAGITYLNLQTYSFDGSGLANTMNINSNVTLYVRAANNYPTGFETINLATNSVTRYDGNLAQTITTQDADGDQILYGDIYFRYNTKTLDGDLDARGRFYIYASTVLDVDIGNSYDISLGERWYNLGTTNLYSNTITFDGAGEQILYSYGTTSAKKFNHVVVDKPADSFFRVYTYDVQIDGDFIINSGLLYNTRTLNVSGDWTSGSSATMDPRGTVTLNGVDQTVTGIGNSDFFNINFNSSGTKTLGGNLDILNDLVIASGVTLDVSPSNYSLFIRGDFTNNGTLEPRTGTIEFTGTATQYIYTLGTTAAKRFYGFKVNKTGGSCYLRGHLWVDAGVYLEGSTSGIFRPDTYNITVGGSWYNSSPLRVIPGTGSVTFNGTTVDTIQTGYSLAYPNQFYTLVLDNPDSIIHADDIRVDNAYTLKQGTALLSGNTFYFGAVNNGADVLDITAENGDAIFDLGTGGHLNVRGGNSVNVASTSNLSIIRVVGTKLNKTEVTYWGNTGYGFTVGSGGRIYARNYLFSYMDASGIMVDGGEIAGTVATPDTADDFSNGTFANGVAGGRYLYIDNSQTMQIDSVGFISSLGASGFNVRKNNDAGNITFFNSTGIYKGDTYEDDPFNRITWNQLTDNNQWTGTTSSDWHTASNWSKGTVPIATDDVLIPNVTTDPLISNGNAICAALNIEGGGFLQLGNSRDLTVSGSMEIFGTVTVFGSENIYVKEDFSNSGTLNAGSGTFIFNGTIQTINSGGVGTTRRFSSIQIASGTSVSLLNNVRVKNNFEIQSGGSLDVSSANRLIYVGGTWINSGTFVYRAGTVYFEGNTAQTITGSGTNDFFNIQFSGTGSKTLNGTLDINGTFTNNSGTTVDGGSSTVYMGANMVNYGTFTGNTSIVIFDRVGTQYIQGSSTINFHNLRLAGTGAKLLAVDASVNGVVEAKSTINYFNLQTYTLTGSGLNDSLKVENTVRLYVRSADNFPVGFEGFTFAAGSFVRYDGDLRQTIRTKDNNGNAISYGWLEIYHTTNPFRKMLENGDLIVQGRLYVEDGDTLDVSTNNYNITVGEYYYNYGFLLANGAAVQNSVTMNGSATQTIAAPGSGTGREFYDLIINTANGVNCNFNTVNSVYINNDLTIQSGELNPNGNRNIYVKGNLTCVSGHYLPSTSTLHFNGAGAGSIQLNGSTLFNLELDGTAVNYSLADDLAMTGNLTIDAGNTLDINGNTLAFGNGADVFSVYGTLDVDSGAQLKLFNTASLTVFNGGQINVVGTSGNIARVSRNSTTGSYSFEVQSGATIAAKFYQFEYMNQNGIKINGGTIDLTNNFSEGTFTNGTTNGKFLAIIGNSQTLSGANKILNVQFPSDPGGTSFNVSVTSSTGSYNFEDASGNFEGEAFEFDPDALVSWTYTTITRQWTGTVSSDWNIANNWSPQAVPSISDNVVITTQSNMPIISNADAACRNLSLNGGSLTLQGSYDLTVNSNFTIASGASFTVNANSDTVFVYGDWSNSGTYSHGTGPVVFRGSASQNLSSGGTGSGKRFYDLIFEKDGTSQVTLSGSDLQVDNDLTITTGRFASGNRAIYVSGNWSNTSGEFDSGTSTVNLIGGAANTLTANGFDFYNLTINTSGGSIAAQDNQRVVNDMFLTAGTFFVNSNELAVGNATGDRISVQGILDVNANGIVKIKGGSAGLNVESGGVLKAIGTSAVALAEITRYGTTGYYPIIFNSGSEFDARYAKFAYTDDSGIWVKSGATINMTDKLLGTVFENGSGNSYLRISNSQALGIVTDLTFNSGSSNPTYNIDYDGTGSVLFNNYKGDRAGARFERDNGPDPRGNVRWTFTETQSVSAGNTYTFGNDLEITVTTAGTLTGITVQLVDSRFNGYQKTYARYYDITTTPAVAASYDINMKTYYADGTNGSSNEINDNEDDSNPNLWANIAGDNTGPYHTSNNPTENSVFASGITDSLAAFWFPSNEESDASLPVELISLNAIGGDGYVEIQWETASELDNLGFIIERMGENGLFAELASYRDYSELQPSGDVATGASYSFRDVTITEEGLYTYRLLQVDVDGSINRIGDDLEVFASDPLPTEFSLGQNYPNPFNPETTIRYDLPREAKVSLYIYNTAGQLVRRLINGTSEQAGKKRVVWNGNDENGRQVASGLYFYMIQASSFKAVKKMILIK